MLGHAYLREYHIAARHSQFFAKYLPESQFCLGLHCGHFPLPHHLKVHGATQQETGAKG